VELVLVAGAPRPEAELVKQAAGRLGMAIASFSALKSEAREPPLGKVGRDNGDAAHPMLFLSQQPGFASPRAARVLTCALDARIARAVKFWGFDKNDVVLSLGLNAGDASVVVDALQAPLEAGASLAFPERRAAMEPVWDFWSALRDEESATFVFVGLEWCWKLLDEHDRFSTKMRKELAARWAKQPLRRTVAVARPGAVMSRDLCRRWEEVFHCPLTLLFSCAEVGTLYTVEPSLTGPAGVGSFAEGLSWRIEHGELWVHGNTLFDSYHGRKRTSEQAFDATDGFCRTFHFVDVSASGDVLPSPGRYENEVESNTSKHLHSGPDPLSYPNMQGNWEVKEVPMRKYEKWRTAWGGTDITKKHNTAWKYYTGKYK